jgi:hypothetical protein
MTRTFSVTIHRPDFEEDAYGNQIPSGDYTDIVVRAYRVDPASAREITRGFSASGGTEQGQQTMITVAVGYFPPGTDIRETDELTANGKRYMVAGVIPIAGRIPSVVKRIQADLAAIS